MGKDKEREKDEDNHEDKDKDKELSHVVNVTHMIRVQTKDKE